jgi:hypothetical protein
MAFDLSFSAEFFFAEGEPYDRSGNAVDDQGRPISVWSAINMMEEAAWSNMAYDVFGCEAEYLTPEAVLDRIRKTDTCSNLTTPVKVWIDEAGFYRVEVW